MTSLKEMVWMRLLAFFVDRLAMIPCAAPRLWAQSNASKGGNEAKFAITFGGTRV